MHARFYPQIIRFDFQSLALWVVVLSLLSLGRLAFCGPIHDAVKKGDLAKVEELLKSDPNLASEPGPGGETPLQLAAGLGRLDVAEYLITHKADVNSYGKDKFRSTPLSLAVERGQTDMVLMLLAHNADVDAADAIGQTPLSQAIYESGNVRGSRKDVYLKMVDLLFQHGANLNSRDSAGNTPLHNAAWSGDIPITEFLISHGARIDVTDDYGKTPAQLARGKEIRGLFSTSASQTSANTSTPFPADKSAPMTYLLEFVKSDLQFKANLREQPFDQISSEIDAFLAGQLAPQGFEAQTSAKDGSPLVRLTLENAAVVQFNGAILVLTVKVQVTGNNTQPVFSKEYTGAAMPNVIARVSTLMKQAEFHIAESVAWDPTFTKALISASPQTRPQ